MTNNILTSIKANEANPIELQDLLLDYFGNSSGAPDNCVEYKRKDGQTALRLRYDKNWKPEALIPCPGFKSDDEKKLAAKIIDQLLTPGPDKIGKKALFSAVPTIGWYKFEDRFQLYPVPPEAPRPTVFSAQHPLILEVKFQSSSSGMVSLRRQRRVQREIELLCTSLINWPLTSMKASLTYHWVHDPDGSNPNAVYLQEFYNWSSAVWQADEFSKSDAVVAIDTIDPQTHYNRQGRTIEQVFDIPSDFPNLVSKYFRLQNSDREKFLRAAYWLQHAQNVWSSSRSSSFEAHVRAIEAIMPAESMGPACPACKRPTGKTRSDQFVEFVDALVAKQVPEENRKKFYRTRSALSHGGKLLHEDEEGFSLAPQAWAESMELWALAVLVRITLHNWLINQK